MKVNHLLVIVISR